MLTGCYEMYPAGYNGQKTWRINKITGAVALCEWDSDSAIDLSDRRATAFAQCAAVAEMPALKTPAAFHPLAP